MKKKNDASLDSFVSAFSVNFENLINLPCYVFWKDTQGVYLGYNDYGAQNLGYKNGSEIFGKTDFDLFPYDVAEIYQKNDKEVITENKQLFVPERGQLKNNFPVIFLSYKMPIYDKNNQIVGVIGLAFTRSTHEAKCARANDLSIINLAQYCNVCPNEVKSPCLALSEQEKQCLQYLCEGLTLKMIAKRLEISPKTVETYIERAKIKMNCHNKAELILAFTKMNCCD